jgi:outer membrane protein assembly factor BamA
MLLAVALVVAQIQIHGNVITSDAEMRHIIGVEVGATFEESTIDEVDARLRSAKRFKDIQVLKRFASISDPSQIALVVIVDEGRVKIAETGDPAHPYQAVKNHWPRLMFLPILRRDDRYGLTYGVRVAIPQAVGKDSRLLFPFAWGGEKQVGVELDKPNGDGLFSRIRASASWLEHTHPVFEEREQRADVWVRGEHWFRPQLRVGATGGVQREVFSGSTDLFSHFGADIVVDTRIDPVLPRNAVYGRAAWTRLAGGNLTELDGRAYVGVIGQLIFGVRAQRTAADSSLPVYLKPIFGGAANVRGFSGGTAVGDTLTAGSAELILPLTSAAKIAKVGLSAFTDRGAISCSPSTSVSCDESWKSGYGGSIWAAAAMFRLNVEVAHGIGASTRAQVTGNVSF